MVILVHELAQAPRPLPPCCSDVSKLAPPPNLGGGGRREGACPFPLGNITATSSSVSISLQLYLYLNPHPHMNIYLYKQIHQLANIQGISFQDRHSRDFPGGPVAKTLHSQWTGPKFDP